MSSCGMTPSSAQASQAASSTSSHFWYLFSSDHTRFTRQGITYQYRHTRPGQEHLGNSKGLVVDRYRQQGHYVIYAGDGRSDFEAAERADLVFAHKVLAEECQRKQIPFQPFQDFGDVLAALRGFSANGRRSGAPLPEEIPPFPPLPKGS